MSEPSTAAEALEEIHSRSCVPSQHDPVCRLLREALADRDSVEAALRSALDLTERNLRLAVQGKPVRDMTENLAENRAAMGRGSWSDLWGIAPNFTAAP